MFNSCRAILQIKDEYLALLNMCSVKDGAGTVNDVLGTVPEAAKGILCIFSVAQATAKKLNENETRAKVFSSTFEQAKASPYWTVFKAELVEEFEAYKKTTESDERPEAQQEKSSA